MCDCHWSSACVIPIATKIIAAISEAPHDGSRPVLQRSSSVQSSCSRGTEKMHLRRVIIRAGQAALGTGADQGEGKGG